MEEIILNLFIKNNIIIKKEIFNRLFQLYNESNKNDTINLLLKLISYIWILKDKRLFLDIKMKCIYKNDISKYILNGLSLYNLINISSIIIYLYIIQLEKKK